MVTIRQNVPGQVAGLLAVGHCVGQIAEVSVLHWSQIPLGSGDVLVPEQVHDGGDVSFAKPACCHRRSELMKPAMLTGQPGLFADAFAHF